MIISSVQVIADRVLVVGSQLQPVSVASSCTFVGGKSGKFILWLTECFKGGPADHLVCSCYVQKVVPGGLKNSLLC